MNQKVSKTVFLMASRTGGPLIPLLALKDDLSLQKPDLKFVIVGIKSGVEEKIAAQEKIPLIFLPEVKNRFADLRSKNLLGKIILKIENFLLLVWTLLGLVFSVFLSCFFLLKYQPKLILSTSNFLSVPMIWAAAFLNLFYPRNSKIKIAIHLLDPQNHTVKLTKPFADLLTTGFEQMAEKLGPKTILVPNPIRHKLFAQYSPNEAKLKLVESGLIKQESLNKPLFLIFGGGSGAKFINDWVLENAKELTKVCTILHLTGFLQKSVEKYDLADFYQINGLTDLMPVALVASDLVMARAGMSSSSELLYLQKPAFIVPMPDSHQIENAALVQNYFQILEQKNVDQWLDQVLYQIKNDFEHAKLVKWDVYTQKNNQKYVDLLLSLIS
jgi:UDP-N-acetylglucosamine--N-acetylmuramyl-(pentapeptide) pyrophosphoryl-undecaprenol N-acetylglucosamine transferase